MDRVKVKRTAIVTAGIGLLGVSTAIVAEAATAPQADSLGICSNGQFSTYAEIFTAEAQAAGLGNAANANPNLANPNAAIPNAANPNPSPSPVAPANGIDINGPAQAANGIANAVNPNAVNPNAVNPIGAAPVANGNANTAADPGVVNKGGGVRETALVASGTCQQFTLSNVGNGTIAEVRGFMQGVNGAMPFIIARVNFDKAPGGAVNVETSGTPTKPMIAEVANGNAANPNVMPANGNAVNPNVMPANGNAANPNVMPPNGNAANPNVIPPNGNVVNPNVMAPAPAPAPAILPSPSVSPTPGRPQVTAAGS